MSISEYIFLAILSIIFPVLPVVAGIVLIGSCLPAATCSTPAEEVSS